MGNIIFDFLVFFFFKKRKKKDTFRFDFVKDTHVTLSETRNCRTVERMDLHRNTFKIFKKDLEVNGQVYKYFDVTQLNDDKYGKLIFFV